MMTRDKLLKLVGRERRHSCSRRYGLGCLPFHLDRSWQSLGPCRRDSLVEVIRARSGTLYERGCMLVAIKMSDSHRKRHLRTVLCTPRYRLRPLQSRSSHSMPSLHSVKGKRIMHHALRGSLPGAFIVMFKLLWTKRLAGRVHAVLARI